MRNRTEGVSHQRSGDNDWNNLFITFLRQNICFAKVAYLRLINEKKPTFFKQVIHNF